MRRVGPGLKSRRGFFASTGILMGATAGLGGLPARRQSTAGGLAAVVASVDGSRA